MCNRNTIPARLRIGQDAFHYQATEMLALSCHAGTSSGAVVCETGAEVSLVLGATIASHRAAEDHSLSSTHRVMVRLGLYQNLELTDLRGFGENFI